MTAVTVVASVVLGLVFVVAGASKLAAGQNWPAQARGLDAPSWAIPLVPWLELVVGAFLIVQLAAPFAAIAALGLLVVFTGAIARKLAAGEHPPCACFGAWAPRPIGPIHLVRNVALGAIAVVAMFA